MRSLSLVSKTFFFFLLVPLVVAMPDALETKVCANLNLTFGECGVFLDSLNCTVNVSETINVTRIINHSTNVTIREVYHHNYTVSRDGLALLQDLRELELDFKEWKVDAKQELLDYIDGHPVKETIYVNNTKDFDLSGFVTHQDLVKALDNQPSTLVSTSDDEPLNPLWILGGLVLVGLVVYYFKKDRHPPPTPPSQQPPPQEPSGYVELPAVKRL